MPSRTMCNDHATRSVGISFIHRRATIPAGPAWSAAAPCRMQAKADARKDRKRSIRNEMLQLRSNCPVGYGQQCWTTMHK